MKYDWMVDVCDMLGQGGFFSASFTGDLCMLDEGRMDKVSALGPVIHWRMLLIIAR